MIVALSFVVGGAFISTIVWASERLGTKIGGVIAGIPSMLLVSMTFITIAEGAEATKEATLLVPILLVAALFYSYIFVLTAEKLSARQKHISASIVATLAWTLFSLAARNAFSEATFGIVIASGIVGILIFYVLFRKYQDQKATASSVSGKIYVTRFVLAGLVVSSAVVLSRLLDPTWGGLAASFPAAFASSLYFLNATHGCEFAKGFVKKIPTGIVSTFLFIVILHVSLVNLSSPLAFLLALAGALFYSGTILLFKLR